MCHCRKIERHERHNDIKWANYRANNPFQLDTNKLKIFCTAVNIHESNKNTGQNMGLQKYSQQIPIHRLDIETFVLFRI